MATVDQIRASATAALGAASSLSVASNLVAPAPDAVVVPEASTSDIVRPAPTQVSPQQTIDALQTQLAQALAIIASNNIAKSIPATATEPRTYHSSAPFINFHVMKGPGICEAFQFKGHKLTTDDPLAIKFLEDAIASGNTGFSHAPIPDKPTAEEIEMKRDLMGLAIVARDKMVAAGEKVA